MRDEPSDPDRAMDPALPHSPSGAERDLRSRAEGRVGALGPDDVEALSPEETARLLHDLRVHEIQLEMQNDELRQVQDALSASRARYFDLYDLAPVGYFAISQQGLIMEANLTGASLLGRPRASLIMQPLTRFVAPEDQDAYYYCHKRLQETGERQVCEVRMLVQGSQTSEFWARMESIIAPGEDGAAAFRVTISDMTESKRAEQEIARLARFPGENPHPVLRAAADGTVLYTNSAGERLLKGLGSWLGRPLPNAWRALVTEALDSGSRVETEFQLEVGTLYVTFAPVVEHGYVNMYGLDITRRKRAEEALRVSEGELRRARDWLEIRVRERTAELVEINEELRAEIDERQRAEEALAASEERFRQLADHIDHVFWIADSPAFRLLYISRAYEELWGQDRQTLYDRPTSFLDAIHPDDRALVAAAFENGFREEQERQFRLVRSDGSLRWVRVRVFPIRDEHGVAYRLAGIAEDVTEHVQAVQLLEQGVEERTRQLSGLLQIASSITLTLELGPLLDVILDGLQSLVGYESATIYEVQGESLVALAHRGRESAEPAQARIRLSESPIARGVLGDQAPMVISGMAGAADDALLAPVAGWAKTGLAAPLGIRERVVGLLVVYSARPARYADSDARLLVALANQAAVGIENAHLYEQGQELAAMEERQRLARDLHDAVSQTLFSANIVAEALPRIWDRDPEDVRRRLPELHRLTSGALAEMRALLLELRPDALLDVALSELLRQAVDAFSGRTRTAASLVLVGQHALPGAVQIALYRIAQEALNNVVKHARAGEVTVHLRNEPGQVELRIRDDGQGFDPERIAAGGLGLSILREQARAIGASLQISSQPGKGTEIAVEWTATV